MNTARHLKLLAAVTIVLLTLSGFSPARSSGGGGGKGGSSGGVGKSRTGGGSGGGGCSSKKSGSHSDYDGSSSSGSSSTGSSSSGSGSGGTGRTGRSTASGTVTGCATPSRPSATVQVRNPNGSASTLTVRVDFNGADGISRDSGSATVRVPGSGTKRVKVPMTDPAQADEVRDCVLVSVR